MFKNLSPGEKRRLCQLDDVATLYRKEVFDDLRFVQIPFAEDLEIGTRILQNGYKIAFLHSVGVIHSHNRSASYFLKRYYIDYITLPRILSYEVPYVFESHSSARDVFSYVVWLYAVLNACIESLKSVSFDESGEKMILKVRTLIEDISKSDPSELRKFERSDESLDLVFDEIEKVVGRTDLKANRAVIQQYFDRLDDYKPYMRIYNSLWEKKTEFIDLLYKLFSITAAMAFGNYYLFRSSNREVNQESSVLNHILSGGV
ncbi:MAG: glycosyltransferase family 2 protein [Nitrososphaerales archaeon]